MLKTIVWNINRKIKDLAFFEIGKIYTKENTSYKEEETVSIGITGDIFDNWNLGKKKSDFFYLKGIVWNLLEGLGMKDIVGSPQAIAGFSPSACSYIETAKGENIGFMGKVNKEQNLKFDIDEDVFFAQIYLRKLLNLARMEPKFKPTPKYPSIERDISIIVDKE